MRFPTSSSLALLLLSFGSSQLSAQIITGAPLPPVTAPPVQETSRAPERAFDRAELERIASPIALYPDPLLAQVLTAATFSQEIPLALAWVDARRQLSTQQLVLALSAEQVSWDASVQSLVAFPTVLRMLAGSMRWTEEVGQAFSVQHEDVMDAVQHLRSQAKTYGYLRSTPDVQVIADSPAIEIVPVNPAYVVVPYYNPVIVFARPRPHFIVSSGIYLGFGVHLGSWYEPYGYRTNGFYWPARAVVVPSSRWNYGYRNSPYQPRYDGRHYETSHYDNTRHAVPRPQYTQQQPYTREVVVRSANGGQGNYTSRSYPSPHTEHMSQGQHTGSSSSGGGGRTATNRDHGSRH